MAKVTYKLEVAEFGKAWRLYAIRDSFNACMSLKQKLVRQGKKVRIS